MGVGTDRFITFSIKIRNIAEYSNLGWSIWQLLIITKFNSTKSIFLIMSSIIIFKYDFRIIKVGARNFLNVFSSGYNILI